MQFLRCTVWGKWGMQFQIYVGPQQRLLGNFHSLIGTKPLLTCSGKPFLAISSLFWHAQETFQDAQMNYCQEKNVLMFFALYQSALAFAASHFYPPSIFFFFWTSFLENIQLFISTPVWILCSIALTASCGFWMFTVVGLSANSPLPQEINRFYERTKNTMLPGSRPLQCCSLRWLVYIITKDKTQMWKECSQNKALGRTQEKAGGMGGGACSACLSILQLQLHRLDSSAVQPDVPRTNKPLVEKLATG